MSAARSTAQAAAEYVSAGMLLVPLRAHSKAPALDHWQLHENAISTVEQAERINGGGIGIAHAWSGTCALDVDDYAGASARFAARGVDLAQLLAHGVQIKSGRDGRAKLLLRLPPRVAPLQTRRILSGGHVLLELRCADRNGNTVQDVLPPSIHPDTRKPYQWVGDWRHLPEIPEPLLAVWRALLSGDAAAERESPPPPRMRLARDVIADLRSALAAMRSDDRELWVRMGLALYCLGDVGRGLWFEWSQTSQKFDPVDAARVWDSLQPGKIDYRAVFAEAQRHGWHNPASKQKTRRHSNSHVPHVPDVEPNTGAEFAGTADGTPHESDVPKRPDFVVYDDWAQVEWREQKLKPGVWFFGTRTQGKADRAEAVPYEQWVCSPLHVEAVTSDAHSNNFGRLLRFIDTHGRERHWAMPMELLRGSGEDLRGELLAMGVLIDPNAHKLLGQYLQWETPERKVRCALQVGWCGDSFVLPDTVIGPSAEKVIYQSGERGHDEYTTGGTLEGWRADVAGRAINNPLLLLAVSAAFAGPLLERCGGESGGIHFLGDSSTGKTTAIEAACSVWGGQNYRRSWRATSNGIEGAAALSNDCLLALDEISECDPQEVGAIVYALGNGRGKQRASRTGVARSVTRWRCMVLSSGERSIATTMLDGGFRAKAGQGVRLLDFPASSKFGIYDHLHGYASGAALSDAIRASARQHHGHAGREFLRRLTADPRDFAALYERTKNLAVFNVPGAEGQVKRAAARFALIAMAGERATEYGLTGWEEGASIGAAAKAFELWCAQRGRGNDERQQVLRAVADFIERHGDSRFSYRNAHQNEELMVRDRAGWWDHDSDGARVYLFLAAGMRDALKGFEFKRALDFLGTAGALPSAPASGERAAPESIGGRKHRVYRVDPDKLDVGHDA